MRNPMRAAAGAFTLLGLLATAVPGVAADDTGAKPDCSKASAMMQPDHMMAASPAVASPEPQRSIDRSFAQAMQEMHDHTMALAKLEMACGTDAHLKAQAKKILRDPAYSSLDFRNIVP